MQADETMTKQESEEMIKQTLKKYSTIVRLLDEETLYGAVVLSQRRRGMPVLFFLGKE